MKLARVELDYVAAPRRPLWPGIAVLSVSLALAGHLTLTQRAVHRELANLASVQGARELVQARGASKAGDEELRQAETVVRQLTLPWGDIVRAIEGASMREVGVLNMQPDAQQRMLKLTAEARSREAMLEYVRRIAQTKGLSNVYIVSHQVQTEDPSRPIQFSVQASLGAAK
jgi:Tfp pilus assembly protein PilN